MKGGDKLSKNGTDSFISNKEKRKRIEDIVRKYSDFIFRLAYQNLHNRFDAEDILQEVSVTLVTANAPLYDEAHLKSWLVTVTLNKCRNLKRAEKRREFIPLDECLALEAPKANEIMEELWRLPEKYRNTVYLYYYESFKISEIAEMLGKSPNTVSSWLRRARKALGIIIKQEEKDE